ncbi:MAG: hypothetical protein LBS19_07460 [Clostridiales bacterium]|jgi:hypothetical protein|nr:hypothetical protein [Clostridiales bacterium]
MRLRIRRAPQTFYDFYIREITPKLKEIDVFLKSSDGGISTDDAAELLHISRDEVVCIMRKEHIKKLNSRNFIRVMLRGSSAICKYLRRETELGSPLTYTQDDIAYIYGLDPVDVARACVETGINEATAFTLPSLFYHIPEHLA